MADNDLHYFTADGKETTEGASDSVVQYTEADATVRGLKFKAVESTPAKGPTPDELMALANLDGSETTPTPVKAPVDPEPQTGPRPAKK